jgi:hypothetical protein
LASGGLALALGVGLPDPGTAERVYAAVIGLLGCVLAVGWLQSTAEGGAPRGRFSIANDDPEDDPPQAPTVEAAKHLERALGLGTATIGSFTLIVQPRLQALARSKLGRADIQLGDMAASRLLGDGWLLVDPDAPPPQDRLATGIPLGRLEQLVDALEQLP